MTEKDPPPSGPVDTGIAAGHRVARNSALRAGGYAAGAGLFFLVVILIARYLGVEGFGNYSFIMAVVGIFQLIADMGVRNVVIRDLARDPASLAERLGVARTLLVMLSFASLLLVAAVAFALPLEPEVRQSMLLAGVAVMTTFYALGYSAVLRAFERMDADILGFVAHKALLLGLMLAVCRTSWGLRGVFAANLLANGALYLYYRVLVGMRHGRTRLSRDFRAAWVLLVDSFPLGVAEVLRRLTWQVDRLVLTAMGGPGAVGLFSTAYKFLEAFKPLAQNITLPLFPLFSRLALSSTAEVFGAYSRSLRFLYAVGVPCAALLMVLSERLVVMLFGAPYRDASDSLAIVAPVAVLLLPTSLYGYLFTALGRQRVYTACVSVALVVNVSLDLLLIPFYSHRGAAVASLAAELALFLAGVVAIARLGGGLASLSMLWRPVLACLLPAAVLYWLRGAWLPAVAATAILGFAGYALLLLAMGAIDREDLLVALRRRPHRG